MGKKFELMGTSIISLRTLTYFYQNEDADFLNGKHALWINYSNNVVRQPELSIRDFDCQRVMVEGTFDKDKTGHLGGSAASIIDVTRIMKETRYFDGKKKLVDENLSTEKIIK